MVRLGTFSSETLKKFLHGRQFPDDNAVKEVVTGHLTPMMFHLF